MSARCFGCKQTVLLVRVRSRASLDTEILSVDPEPNPLGSLAVRRRAHTWTGYRLYSTQVPLPAYQRHTLHTCSEKGAA